MEAVQDINRSNWDDAALLGPTPFIESTAPAVIAFAEKAIAGATDEAERGVRLFNAVRDEIRYDPYQITLTEHCFRATTPLTDGSAFCIPKSVLLAAAARVVGIPSALGFADVKNHLTSERLHEAMGNDLFIYHGYTLLKLDGVWRKASAAFNLSLCEKFGLKPLAFDGRSDALLHPFDEAGNRHMEYVNDRGVFPDVPFEEISRAFRSHYPKFFEVDRTAGPRFEEETPLKD